MIRKKDKLTFIDLFAGIGGFRFGFEAVGYRCVYGSENNKFCRETYKENFGDYPDGDITQVDALQVPEHDVLTGGFPCQPFSISGRKKGFEDTRGTLIYDVLRIIEKKNPKVVLLENVKHLIHHDKGKTIKVILEALQKLGYKNIAWKILNASDFGVPQNRERLIIIAHKEKLFDFSKVTTLPKPKLKSFLDKVGNFEYLKEPYTLIENPKVQESGLIFVGYRNKSIRKKGVRNGTEHLSRVHKQPNRIYSSDGVHPTLPSQETTGRFWILHKGKVRKLTINECYRLMGFPENFKKISPNSELYRQVGNAVCVPMIKELAVQIKKQLL